MMGDLLKPLDSVGLQDFPWAICTDGGDSGEGEGAVTLLQALFILQPKSDTIRGWVLRMDILV